MKNRYLIKMLSALLTVVLCVSAMLPLCAAAARQPARDPANKLETIIPVGKAHAKVKLTRTGAEFTAWEIPTEYNLGFKDGRKVRISAQNSVQIGNSGPGQNGSPRQVGIAFKADAEGGELTFYAMLTFEEETQRCRFDVGQADLPEEDWSMLENEGDSYAVMFVSGNGIYSELCDTEVDKGGTGNYIAHRLHNIIERIRTFFASLYYLLSR